MNFEFDTNFVTALASFDVEPKKPGKNTKIYKMGETYTPLAKMPLQLKQIAEYLQSTGMSGTGSQIIIRMIDDGMIVTKQDPAVLFAFYARKLETMGMVRV